MKSNSILLYAKLGFLSWISFLCVPFSNAKTDVTIYGITSADPTGKTAMRDGLDFSPFRRDKRFRSLLRRYQINLSSTSFRVPTPDFVLDMFCSEILENPVNTIIQAVHPYVQPENGTKYVANIAAYLGIPIISWNIKYTGLNENTESKRQLLLAPTIKHQAQAMLAVLRTYNWTDFTLVTSFYDGYEDFVSSIKTLVKNNNEKVTSPTKYRILGDDAFTFDLSNETITRRKLRDINETETRIFLVYADKTQTMDLFDIADDMGFIKKGYVWIISHNCVGDGYIPGDERAPRPFPAGTLAIYVPQGQEEMTKSVQKAVKIWMTALSDLNRRRVLSSMMLFPNFTCNDTGRMNWNDGRVLHNAMKKVKLKNELVEFDDHGVNIHAKLEILNVHSGSRRSKIWSKAGEWNTSSGINMHGIKWMGDTVFPPRGRPDKYKLRIVTKIEKPYVEKNTTVPVNATTCPNNTLLCTVNVEGTNGTGAGRMTEKRCCTGLALDLLKIFSTRLEFDFELFEVTDGEWGSQDNATGEWTGLIGTLQREEADMAVTAMAITPQWLNQVNFSVPYMETGISIMVAKRKGQISATAFLEPFDAWSWCFILIFSVHATGTAIFIFEWISPYGMKENAKPEEHRFSLFRSFWLIWAMLFGASVSTDSPNGVSSRFLGNIWALFCLVFIASYTANLAAFMITREEYYDLSGIQDWRLNPYSMDPPFKYSTVDGSPSSLSISAYHKQKFNYMQKEKLLQKDLETSITKLKEGEIHALLYDATVLDYYAGKDTECRLLTVGNRYAMTGYGIAFPRKSRWIHKVNRIILELQQYGDIDRLQKFWLAGACKDKTSISNQQSHKLGILNFTSAFIFLAAGIFLGITVLACEHAYFKFGRKELKKWDKCGCCALVSYSMNQSLSFETSVMKAIDMKVKHKCKDPICQTLLWEARHKLDVALMTIQALREAQRRDLQPSPKAIQMKNEKVSPDLHPEPKEQTMYDDEFRSDNEPTETDPFLPSSSPSASNDLKNIDKKYPDATYPAAEAESVL